MLRNRTRRGAAGDFSSAPEPADNAKRFPPMGTPWGSPRDIVIWIQRDIARAILAQDMHERWSAWGYEPVGSTPEQFAEKFAADLARYARVIRDLGIPSQD